MVLRRRKSRSDKISFHLSDCQIGNGQSQFFFGNSEVKPKFSPGIKSHLRAIVSCATLDYLKQRFTYSWREQIGHFFARISTVT